MADQERVALTLSIAHDVAEILWSRSRRTGRAGETEASFLLEAALVALTRVGVESFSQRVAQAVTGERWYSQSQFDATMAALRRAERERYERRLRDLAIGKSSPERAR